MNEFVYRYYVVSWEDERGSHWVRVRAANEDKAKLAAIGHYLRRFRGVQIDSGALIEKMSVRQIERDEQCY